MKHGKLIGTLVVVGMVVAAMATTAFAQRGGGGSQRNGMGPNMQGFGGPPPMHAVMKFAGNNLFLLQGGTLLKLDAKTLKEDGKLEVVKDTAQTGRPGPALLIPGEKANELLLLADNTFYRINTGNMTVAVKGELPELPQPAAGGIGPQGGPDNRGPQGDQRDLGPQGGPGMGGRGFGGPGMGEGRGDYELQNGTLYLMHGPQLLAIDTNTGKVTAKTTLEMDNAKAK